MDEIIQDEMGNKIKKGTKVLYGAPESIDDPEHQAVVIDISDMDADVDDDTGRSIIVCPVVTIRFISDDTEEKVNTTFFSQDGVPFSDEQEFTFEACDIEVLS